MFKIGDKVRVVSSEYMDLKVGDLGIIIGYWGDMYVPSMPFPYLLKSETEDYWMADCELQKCVEH